MGRDDTEDEERTMAQAKDDKVESDVQRKMREALEAKQARSRTAHGEDHRGARGVGPASNDKQKRQFRRKSGG